MVNVYLRAPVLFSRCLKCSVVVPLSSSPRLPHATSVAAVTSNYAAGSHLFSFFRRGSRSFSSQKRQGHTEIPDDVLVDEEKIPGYRPDSYFPANPGDLIENRYQLNAKLGWGASSTVWLARDTHK